MGILVRSLGKAGSVVSSSDSQQFHSGFVVLESGKEVGEHKTGGGEELIVVIKGTAEISHDGKTEKARAPSIILVPAHTVHNVRNMANVPLYYTYVYNMAMDRPR